MSEIQSVSLDDARFELPVAESNLPRPLLQVPNLDDAADKPSEPEPTSAKRSEDHSPKIEEPVRRFHKVIAVLRQPGDWWRMVHASRHALWLAGLIVLLVATFLLISGNGGPELDEPKVASDEVDPRIPLAQPKVEVDEGPTIDLVHEPFSVSESLNSGTQTNSLEKKFPKADLAGAQLLAPKLDGQVVRQQQPVTDARLAKANEPIEPVQNRGDFKPAAPRVEVPPARSGFQFAGRNPVSSQQPTDWRFQDYPETNPNYYEYPSNSAPGWRLARQMEDSRVDPRAKRDGNWQDSRQNLRQNVGPPSRGN